MRGNHALAVLYDLAMAISGETETGPLARRFLQQLLYHTGYSCGVLLREVVSGDITLASVVGNRMLKSRVGSDVALAEHLYRGPVGQIDGLNLEEQFGPGVNYTYGLRLPVEGVGVILLLTTAANESEYDYSQIFLPVLANFSRSFQLCLENEKARQQLREELEHRGKLLNSLKQVNDELERANAAKSEFLSSMSHELRTPLNAIIGFSQVLEIDPTLAPAHLDSVHEIVHAGRHLLDLINEVLDLSRIESGHTLVELEPVGIARLVEECVSLIKPVAAPGGIVIAFGHLDGYAVLADKTRLKQVVLNLLSNAVKYNRQNGSIWIDAEIRPDNRIRIIVTDTGYGIDESKLAMLFEPFNRLGAEQTHIEGTGIGLAITKRLIELMHGQVGVESRLNEGSRFWIELPLDNGVQEITADGRSPNTAKPGHGGIVHEVLYIDDVPMNLRLVGQMFDRRDDVALSTAHEPQLGLDMARALRPSLILVDLDIPGLDGEKLLNNLHDVDGLADTPIVALTSEPEQSQHKLESGAGFDAYLHKPLHVDSFMASVAVYLDPDDSRRGENHAE